MKYKMTEWFRAIKQGNTEKVRHMIDSGEDVNQVDRKDKGPGIYWAACYGHVSICILLIRHKSNINQPVRWGSIALHAACDRGQLECVRILLSHDSLVNCQNAMGDTPLHLAAYRGHYEICRRLLQAGASASLVNHKNKTAVVEADSLNHRKILKLLKEGVPRQVNTEQIVSSQRESGRLGLLQDAEYHSADRPVNNGLHPVNGSKPPDGYNNKRTYPRIRGESIHLKEGEFYGIEQNEHHYIPPVRYADGKELREVRQQLRELEDRYDDLQVDVAMKNECIDNLTKEREDRSDLLNQQDNLIAQYMSANATMAKQSNELRNELHRLRAEFAKCETEKHKLTQDLYALRQSMQSALVGEERYVRHRDEDCVTKSMSYIDFDSSRLMARGMAFISPSMTSNSSPTSSIQTANTTRCATASSISSVSSLNDHCHNFFKSLYNTCNMECLKAALSNFSDLSSSEKGCSANECLTSSLRQQIQRIRCRDLISLEVDVDKCWVPNEDYIVYKQIESTPQATSLFIRKDDQLFLLKSSTMRPDKTVEQSLPAEYTVINGLKPHRNICTVYHKYQELSEETVKDRNLRHPKLVVILSYLPRTLQDFATEVRAANLRLPEVFLLQLLYQLLSAVYHLVIQGIVHNNISKDTVCLNSYLTPVVGGFNMAENVRETTEECMKRPSSGEIFRAEMDEMSLQTMQNDMVHNTDLEAIGQLIYSLLASTESQWSTLVEASHYSAGLVHLVQSLCTAKISISAKSALVRTGLLLLRPSFEEFNSVEDSNVWLQCMMIQNISKQPNIERDPEKVLDISESMMVNSGPIERDFLLSVSAEEVWETYQGLKQQNIL